MSRWSVHGAGRRFALAWRSLARSHPRLAAVLPLAVLVSACIASALALSSCGAEQGGFFGGSAPVAMAPTDIRVKLTPQPLPAVDLSTTGGYRVLVDQKVVAQGNSPTGIHVVRSGGTWIINNSLTASGYRLFVEPTDRGYYLRFNGSGYRGKMQLQPAGDSVHVINVLDLESYLAGVLARELYPSWSYQTYRALAVAARTFALYQTLSAGAGKDYDVTNDQSSQVYGGLTGETDLSRRVVQDTRGQVLAFGPPGRETIFMAQYSAACGGHVNAASVIRNAEDIPPLSGGQACDDCCNCKHYRWDPVRISRNDLFKAAAAVYPAVRDGLGGSVARIDVKNTTSYGRSVWLDLVGPAEQKVTLRAEDLRLCLIRSPVPAARKLYSMNCQIRLVGDAFEFYDGKGFGHGVGLCQWGAQGKAEKGWSAEQILAFYYPGSKLFRVY